MEGYRNEVACGEISKLHSFKRKGQKGLKRVKFGKKYKFLHFCVKEIDAEFGIINTASLSDLQCIPSTVGNKKEAGRSLRGKFVKTLAGGEG